LCHKLVDNVTLDTCISIDLIAMVVDAAAEEHCTVNIFDVLYDVMLIDT